MTDQRSPEWFAARCGKFTASRIADLMATTKSRPAASRANLITQLICERMTGIVEVGFTSEAMQWGIDIEPQARAAYAFATGHDVTEIGFVQHPTLANAGASPDGLVNDDGLVEIKCPNSSTHLATIMGRPRYGKYLLQMQWQMACTERQWCDFVSFDPRFPPANQLHVQRVERDDDIIGRIEAAIIEAEIEIATAIAKLDPPQF